jgi:serine/threonine protein kinase
VEQRYRFIRLLGAGAMGEVFLAEHTALGRREAVKILRPELATDPQFIAGFRREARATNRVQHPNIVGVYDFGKLSDGRFYLAMEFAEGVPLDTLLAGEIRLPVARALPILVQLCDAVGHAHSHGVVHRDLKPGNLILGEHRGQVDYLKVLDFGMAKIVTGQANDGPHVSRMGTIMGTPSYMAPEYVAGLAVDGRADVYAIGCIAYEMLTGRPPFTGTNMEIVDAHISQPPRPMRATIDDLPAPLDELVLRCLEKTPARRVASAQELKQAFERVLWPKGKSTHRPPSQPQKSLKPMHNDFETADTGVGVEITRRQRDGSPTERQLKPITLPSIPVMPMDEPDVDDELDEGEEHLRALLLRAAEALLDRGKSNADLIIAVVEVKEAEQDRVKLGHELDAVNRHLDEVEQEAREREAALRFALSDLEFERGQPSLRGEVTAVDLGPRMDLLRTKIARVAAQRERDIGRLVEESVTLTAKLAGLEEDLARLYDKLDAAVRGGIAR